MVTSQLTATEHRITLVLDRRVSLEALLLNRLLRLPATRHQEWLRGLLLLGFRRDDHENQKNQINEKHQMLNNPLFNGMPASEQLPTAFSHWLTENKTRKTKKTSQHSAAKKPPKAETANKPFACLHKVMG